MLVRLLNFFRSDFGKRSVKEVQCKMIDEDASSKYGLMVFAVACLWSVGSEPKDGSTAWIEHFECTG